MQVGHSATLDLAVEVPSERTRPDRHATKCGTKFTIARQLVQQHRSTLVFVNTRRLAERMAHHLAERLGEDIVAAHHGSLSRKLRLDAEASEKWRDQSLVATASLELGIDIGTVDLVVPDRLAALDRRGSAARGPRRSLARRASQGPLLRHHAR